MCLVCREGRAKGFVFSFSASMARPPPESCFGRLGDALRVLARDLLGTVARGEDEVVGWEGLWFCAWAAPTKALTSFMGVKIPSQLALGMATLSYDPVASQGYLEIIFNFWVL